MRANQFIKNFLQDVVRILTAGHAPPNEVAQPRALGRHDFGNLPVLLGRSHGADPLRIHR